MSEKIHNVGIADVRSKLAVALQESRQQKASLVSFEDYWWEARHDSAPSRQDVARRAWEFALKYATADKPGDAS